MPSSHMNIRYRTIRALVRSKEALYVVSFLNRDIYVVSRSSKGLQLQVVELDVEVCEMYVFLC
jgi:hypothetical protein